MYWFIVLIITGTFLALLFQPSMREVVYHGSYTKLDNVPMSQAYASTLNISFEVRGGLLVRQIHHCGPCSATRSPAPCWTRRTGPASHRGPAGGVPGTAPATRRDGPGRAAGRGRRVAAARRGTHTPEPKDPQVRSLLSHIRPIFPTTTATPRRRHAEEWAHRRGSPSRTPVRRAVAPPSLDCCRSRTASIHPRRGARHRLPSLRGARARCRDLCHQLTSPARSRRYRRQRTHGAP
jgi:hypothetical protein